jgi:hypothetical protein
LPRENLFSGTAGVERSAAAKAAQQRTRSKAFGDCAQLASLFSGAAVLKKSA